MLKVACVLGSMGIGFLIPELCGLMGAGKTSIPKPMNALMAVSVGLVTLYLVCR
jgi:molybdenum cofactor biosynthesis enzyme